MSSGDDGVKSDPALLAAGWVRRHVADPARAKESIALYEGMGLEVRAESLKPEDFSDKCGACRSVVCHAYVLIYTRAAEEDAAQEETAT